MKSRVLSFLALVLLAGPAHADTVYTYTGDYFIGEYFSSSGALVPSQVHGVYTTADRVTGSFTVADGFVPGLSQGGHVFAGFGFSPADGGIHFMDGVLSYSFSDGHQTLTKANSTGEFKLTLADVGVLPMWNISIATPTSWITSHCCYEWGDLGRLDADNFGGNACFYYGCAGSHVGTWTVAVPEPMSLLLVVAGIGGIAATRACLRIRP